MSIYVSTLPNGGWRQHITIPKLPEKHTAIQRAREIVEQVKKLNPNLTTSKQYSRNPFPPRTI